MTLEDMVKAIQLQSAEQRTAYPLKSVADDTYGARSDGETHSQFYRRILVRNPGDAR